MPEKSDSKPLDLAAFDDLALQSVTATPTPPPAASAVNSLPIPAELIPQPPPERLVDVSNLSSSDLAEAEAEAAKINFNDSASMLTHGEGVLSGIATSSRQLLSGTRLGEAGEAGQIAATVLDGIKILRISDLQAEAATGHTQPKGLFGKVLGGVFQAKTAFQGFAESRKSFLTVMDQQEAKARKTKADLAVSIELLDQQALSIRQSLHGLKIAIAAGQIALDRAEDELEALRQHAIQTSDPADAAEVQAFRGAIANFRGKIGDMREALVGSAALIPIIGQNRAAAETRMMKISNGILVVIPRLMAIASQAAVQVEIRNAAEGAEKLDEANRQITLLAAKGAHEAAVSAARANAGDHRNLEALSQAADQTIKTMNEVLDIERNIAAQDAEREQKLTEIRNKLVVGMQGVNQRALEK